MGVEACSDVAYDTRQELPEGKWGGVVHSGQLPTLSRGQQRDRQTTNHTYEQFVPRLWEEIIHRDTGNMQNPRTKVASQMVDLIPGPSRCEATVSVGE